MASDPREFGNQRRALLTGSLMSAAGLTASAATAQAPKPAAPMAPPTPVGCGVIGLGLQGRAILAALSRVPGAKVTAVCDTYQAFLNRAKQSAPAASLSPDYRTLLSNPAIQAVFVATPTHLHKEIVLSALQAGKHVYCEAPLAHTVEDARAIAQAAKSSKLIFQSGCQFRSNPQHLHVLKFIRGQVIGATVQARGQWHKKTSWRLGAPTPEREREMNWRLRKATSPGLLGEIGIHSLDTLNWFTKSLPVSVSGFSQTMQWSDGREVPDTVQIVVEYPKNLRFVYDMTLANSFDGTYEVLQGNNGAILLRGERAWMFKEADAPLEGWEVYARKEPVGDETGIALVADATKILALGKIPGKDGSTLDPGKDAGYYAAEAFLQCIREKKSPACGALEGLQATVAALKANEAAVGNTKVEFRPEWFQLA